MSRSLLGSAFGAAHRAVSRVLSPANDPHGRPLRLWWPAADLGDRRTVGAHFHEPLIPAFMGQGRRDSTPTNLGLAVIPQVTVTFAAELIHFPSAVLPSEGICFLAGPTQEEATFYRVLRATTVAGLVEIEATVEP
jgi:hypothetical protein